MPAPQSATVLPQALTAIAQDESIVWWDRPNPIGFALGMHPWLPVVALGIITSAAATIYEWGAVGSKEPAIVTFAALFLAVGYWIIIGGIIRRYRHAQRTVYACTPSRIIILSPHLRYGAFVHAFPPAESWFKQRGWRGLVHINTSETPEAPHAAFYRFCDAIPLFSCKPGFYFLEDSSAIEEAISSYAPPENLPSTLPQ